MNLLFTIPTLPSVNVYEFACGRYVWFRSDLDICNDGSGDPHDDPYHISETAYYNGGKFLNADVDKYIVIPPQLRSMVPGIVMGCQARATNLTTGAWSAAVTGEIGPSDKAGECSCCLARILNPKISYNSGDKTPIYLYELWPDVPATVDGKTYKLEPVA